MSVTQLLATQSYEGSWSASLVPTSDANTTLVNSTDVAERGTQSLKIARTAANANRYHSFTVSQTGDGVFVWRTRVYIPTATFTGAADWSPDLVALDLANAQTLRVGVRKVGSVWTWVSDQATLTGALAFTADGWHVVAVESDYIAGVNTFMRVFIDGQQAGTLTASASSKPATARNGIINRTAGSGGVGTVYFDRTEAFIVPYPAFQAAGPPNSAAAATGATAPNLALTAPTFAAPAAADTKRLVAVLMCRPDTVSFAPPSGWALGPIAAVEPTRGKLQIAYMNRVAAAGDSAAVTTFTAAGATTVAGQMLLLDDIDEDAPFDTSGAAQA